MGQMKETRMPVDLQQLRDLPAAEKFRIVEELWDDLGTSEEPIVIQDWHRSEARSRAAELDARPEIALTREELWERVGGADG